MAAVSYIRKYLVEVGIDVLPGNEGHNVLQPASSFFFLRTLRKSRLRAQYQHRLVATVEIEGMKLHVFEVRWQRFSGGRFPQRGILSRLRRLNSLSGQ